MNRREFTKTVSLGALGFSMMNFDRVGSYPVDELLGRVEPSLFGVDVRLRKEAFNAFDKMRTAALEKGLKIHL